ncbi:hypothetical protein FA10DRAFT_302180 [Acaromyces ingoldii]|uniref:HNH nuclease domain-containing protein n=1 Tax=Acaromyces ingoldii TaxID=215250 RepID=A0A316YNZ4_9BASI|nr:hypothetical protein FA10DRAFT_302180 [Acaromyces ingoldii]PWN90999.1 hypothetical protein FA10DRAFT_302180 [Acaromyces ingoldii]
MSRRIRNVSVFMTKDTAGDSIGSVHSKEIAGFWQHGNVKIGQFRKWLDLCIFVAESEWGIYPIATDNVDPSDGDIISDVDVLTQDPEQVLPTGNYVVLNREKLKHVEVYLSNTHYERQKTSPNLNTSDGRKSSFLRRVRKRDERCVITGRLVSDEEPVLFGAAHILPVALFDAKGFESIATDMGVPLEDAKLDPVSNAILLTPSAHTLYHYRLISIDPDNDYAVTDFTKPGEFHGCRMYSTKREKSVIESVLSTCSSDTTINKRCCEM